MALFENVPKEFWLEAYFEKAIDDNMHLDQIIAFFGDYLITKVSNEFAAEPESRDIVRTGEAIKQLAAEMHDQD